MFVKFGQIASTRADLLPPALVTSLKDLQSNVKPVPVAQVHAVLERELGRPAEKAFATFSEEPLAAASIGQTHVAQTFDGEDVVVKVRRPDVEVGVARDAAVLRWASRIAERRSEAARALRLVRVSEELVRSIGKELDYVEEAAYGRALHAAITDAHVEGVAVPQVRGGMTTDAVLVLERVRGRPVSDAAAVDGCGVRAGRARRPAAPRVPQRDVRQRDVPRRPASGQHPGGRRRDAVVHRLRRSRDHRCRDAAGPAARRHRPGHGRARSHRARLAGHVRLGRSRRQRRRARERDQPSAVRAARRRRLRSADAAEPVGDHGPAESARPAGLHAHRPRCRHPRRHAAWHRSGDQPRENGDGALRLASAVGRGRRVRVGDGASCCARCRPCGCCPRSSRTSHCSCAPGWCGSRSRR